jgi:flagella basal body P-ring formation protein FlgA
VARRCHAFTDRAPRKRQGSDTAVGTLIAPYTRMRITLSTAARASVLLAGLGLAAAVGATTDAALIRQSAERAVRAQAGNAFGLITEAQPLDPRLRLNDCSQALQGFITGDGQVRPQTTVGVRCEDRGGWTIYLIVRVESDTTVLVAKRTLARSTELALTDFDAVRRRIPGLSSDYVGNFNALAGQRLRRPLAPGEPLQLEALTPANIIHRGQQVVLLARGGGIEVRCAGVALADGRADDRIRVQNLSSSQVVEGIVRSDSVVEAPL